MISWLLVGVVAGASSAVAQTVTYQAESATLSGVTVGTSVAGYSGQPKFHHAHMDLINI